MVSFVGEAEAVIDANSRVSLPSIFRDVLPENEKKFYLATGENHSLILFRESDYNEKEVPRLLSLPTELRISAGSAAQPIVLDEKQNRFLLAKKFKEHSGIVKDAKNVVFVGAIDKILVYSNENYNKRGIGKYEYKE
jgi:DNA-binding transcriptional regulator/RsmH inhibitor MraZ